MSGPKPPPGAKPASYYQSPTKPVQATGEGEENSTPVFLKDLSQLKSSVR